MLCDKCKENEAIIFYREVINDHEKTMRLCADCAAEAEKSGLIGKSKPLDIFDNMEFPGDVTFFLGGLFGVPAYQKQKTNEAKKCTLCASTFAELVKSGRVGCPECYKVFAEELAGTVSRLHGATTHCGRAPGKLREGYARRAQIKELEAELKSAIESEEYERAAEIRDKLKSLREPENN